MNKDELIAHIIQQLQSDHQAAVEAAQATYQAATHEENKPENEYDTRGLEASYLAGAQSKRVAEIEETLYVFQHTKIQNFQAKDSIAATALVEVRLIDEQAQKLAHKKSSFVLIMPKGGGQLLKFHGQVVQVITPNSPLGEALIGSKQSNSVVVDIGNESREYEILSIQ